jgi:hypothetical protein
MTYRELVLRVIQQYRAIGRVAPTPMFEGAALDREVLGLRTWPDRPRMLLGARTPEGDWDLDAGSIHGLSVDSILEVFPPAGAAAAETALGHVKVTHVGPTTARVTPSRFEKHAAAPEASLVAGSRARVSSYSYGDMRLKVALQERASPDNDNYVVVPTGRGPRPIELALASLSTTTAGLVVRVDSPAADWFVRTDGRRLLLVPSGGWPGASKARRQFQVEASSEELSARLGEELGKIARVGNLMRMAAAGSTLPIEFQVLRFDSPDGGTPRPFLASSNDIEVRSGEYLEYRVRNLATMPVDVTLLYLGADLSIVGWFPRPDNSIDGQVPPGEEKVIGVRAQIGPPFGWEATVAIAVESSSPRQDFTVLAQRGLIDVERHHLLQSAGSPLLALLCEATACLGELTRGGNIRVTAPRSLGQYAVKATSWLTVEK